MLTAHHADDQAETVLFRTLRGTGIKGLAGIPERGPGGLVRPLLPFRRRELEAYARSCRIPFLTDPSNADPRFARNVLRHEILPRLEGAVAPGAVRSLLRLSRLAREEEEAWESLLPRLLEGVVREADHGRVVVDRSALLAYHPAVRPRLLRALLGGLGIVLDQAGTRAALEVTSSRASGRRRHLPGGVVLTRERDRIVPVKATREGDELLEIPEPGEGAGSLTLAGRIYRVEWRRGGEPRSEWAHAFASCRLTYPLRFRAWSPGDRIRMSYGSKKLSKIFAEARVPVSDRSGRPVLVDGRGALLWVPGVATAPEAAPDEADERLTIGVTETRTA